MSASAIFHVRNLVEDGKRKVISELRNAAAGCAAISFPLPVYLINNSPVGWLCIHISYAFSCLKGYSLNHDL